MRLSGATRKACRVRRVCWARRARRVGQYQYISIGTSTFFNRFLYVSIGTSSSTSQNELKTDFRYEA
eukprot:1741619-Prymnesium_polylepis.1